ncbi:MAG: YlxR family protein [Lachnospiraceae bacterium]|nr:YlxR family protein [Lachnospiraceae bacterium]
MEKKKPLRQCIGCGEKKEKQAFWRIVRTPEEEIILDPTGKAAGRGAYLCPKKECLEAARKRHALSRSFRGQFPDEIYDELAGQLERIKEAAGKDE